MASENAKKVAKKISENLRSGKKIVLGKILEDVGYSPSVCNAPQNVTETQSFKNEMAPIISRWEKERERLTSALEGKDLSKEKYRDVVSSIDILTKNVQLLSGKETERSGIVFNLAKYSEDDTDSV